MQTPLTIDPASTLPLEVRIDRAQRLLRRLEEDVPLLSIRVKDLTPEYQNSAKSFAARMIEQARTELEKLLQEKTSWNAANSAQD